MCFLIHKKNNICTRKLFLSNSDEINVTIALNGIIAGIFDGYIIVYNEIRCVD